MSGAARRWQQWAWTAIRVVASLALAVVVLEGAASALLAVREFGDIQPDTNIRRAQYDSLLGWTGLANLSVPSMFGPGASLTNNADGMRIHRPVSPTLAPGVRRVICSGDSFAHGWGVGDADTFCAALEPHFPGLESLNMAQAGFGIDQAYLWYKRDGARYPHQVHLFAFIWNDFERMALTSFFGYAKPRLRLRDGGIVVENTPVPAWTGSSRWTQASRQLSRLRIVQFLQRFTDQSDSAQLARPEAQVWGVAEAVFRDLDRLNRERGSQLVLVYLPTLADLEAGAWDRRRARLARFASAAHIALVDLTPDIRAVSPDSSAWYFITPNQLIGRGAARHYTVAGNRWVAARLAEHLRAIPPVAAALAGAGDAARRGSR